MVQVHGENMTASNIGASPETRLAAGVTLLGLAVGTTLLVHGLLGGASLSHVGPVALLVFFTAAFHRQLLEWRALVAAVLLMILVVPIRHYELPVQLPIALEPYRVLVAVTALAWLASALIDPRVRLRKTGVVELPLVVFAGAILVSQVLNLDRLQAVSSHATKDTLFFVSYVVVLYFVTSIIVRRYDVRFLVRLLIMASAFVGAFALVESRTGTNVFYQLDRVFPFLKEAGDVDQLSRSSRIRASASAQHPIALGAALALILPIAVCLAMAERKLRWWIATAVLLLGAMGSVSRTVVVMLLGATATLWWLKRAEMKRMIFIAFIPAIVLAHFALPGTIGAFRKSFTTEQLITKSQDAPVGSGRLATLGPALSDEFAPNPVFGEGFATRVTIPDRETPANGPILDNQWLGVLLETGLVGAAALFWLFVRSMRVFGRTGKEDESELGWLLCGVTASIASYAVAMFTFDVFSFIQVTFLLFIILGIGAATLRIVREQGPRTPDGVPSAA